MSAFRRQVKDAENGGPWRALRTLSGNPGHYTDGFVPPQGLWRISYKGKGERFGVLEIVVKTKTGDQVIGLFGRQATAEGELSGSTVPKEAAGDLSIEVRSYGLQWELAIEQR